MITVWAQRACRTNSQSGKDYSRSPTAPEGLPTDGLLAGIVCLSHCVPTVASSLRDAIVAHLVGNMEVQDLNI